LKAYEIVTNLAKVEPGSEATVVVREVAA
jgi:hypothetical protein